MERQQIKERLLKLGIFEDNEYLDKYCELIIQNQNTKKQEGKTNSHHFIPVCYYKKFIPNNSLNREQRNRQALKIANNDQNNFTVNLFYKDHILAHYYLCLCSDSIIKKKMSLAFFCLTFRRWKYQEFDPSKDLSEYQNLYELFIQNNKIQNLGKKRNTQQKLNMSIAAKNRTYTTANYLKGKIWVSKGKIQFRIEKDELDYYLNQGYTQGKTPLGNKMGTYIKNKKKGICTKKIGVKEVYLIELGLSFPNALQASNWLNTYHNNSKDYAGGIRNCCQLYSLRAGGFHWCYKENSYKYINFTYQDIKELESQVKPRETKRKSRNIPIICVENGLEFSSITEAEKWVGQKYIRNVLNKPNAKVGNYHWRSKE